MSVFRIHSALVESTTLTVCQESVHATRKNRIVVTNRLRLFCLRYQRCYRKILRISCKDEVSAKIQQASGPHEDPLTIVMRRKPKWYGHDSRLSGLTKTILEGSVKGGRRQGRHKKQVGRQHQENGQAWSSPSPRGLWRTETNEGNWF